MTGTLTPTDIEDRFEDAARTLRRLPNPPGSTPRGYKSGWPDYVQDKAAYGYNEARVRIVPTARDIGLMEECLGWLAWLEPDDARIVWMRAEGARWRQIGIRVGCVRQTAWRRWVAALATIAKRLNRENRTLNAGGGRSKSLDAKRGGNARKKVAVINCGPDPDQKALTLNAGADSGATAPAENSGSAPAAKAEP